MPFVELKRPAKCIRISGERTVILQDLWKEFFEDKKVQVFLDSSNCLVGLRPSKDVGYKIVERNKGRNHTFYCMQLSRTVTGEFHPTWSKKHKMLIFKYS